MPTGVTRWQRLRRQLLVNQVKQRAPVPAAWKVEWDAFGLDLACCLEDASVALWELRLDGKWAPAMEKGQTLDREWLGDQQLAHAIAVDDTMGVE